MEKVIVGDTVVITDGSQAARLDKYEPYISLGLNRNKFTVIQVDADPMVRHDVGSVCHDIHIEDSETGHIYLHSSTMVKVVDEVGLTVSEIGRRLGYKVRVIEG